MSTNESSRLRKMIVDAMSGHHAHIDLDSTIEDFPVELRGVKASGAPHTAWQLLEHMRIAQWDILEFSRDPKHKSPKWPDEYWPLNPAPVHADDWKKSVEQVVSDRKAFTDLLHTAGDDIYTPFPYGDGQSLFREAVLIVDHTSYHTGEIIILRRLLRDWK